MFKEIAEKLHIKNNVILYVEGNSNLRVGMYRY